MTKILIIEDNEEIATLYQRQLTHEGYSVSIAANGLIGLAKAKNEYPALILLDIVLPKKSGLDVLKDLKKDPKIQMIIVIAISAFGGEENRKQVLALGAVSFIEKELVEPADVAREVKKFLT